MVKERYDPVKKFFFSKEKPNPDDIQIVKNLCTDYRTYRDLGPWIEYDPMRIEIYRLYDPTRFEFKHKNITIELDETMQPFIERFFFLMEKIAVIDEKYSALYFFDENQKLTPEFLDFLKTCQ